MRNRMLMLIALLALLLGGHALALVGEDDGFTGTVPLPDYAPTISEASVRRAAKGVAGIQVNGEGEPEVIQPLVIRIPTCNNAFYDEDTTWTMRVEGGSGHYRYKYYVITLYDPDGGFTKANMNTNSYQNWSEESTYAYRFVVPGDYYLYIYVEDLEATDASGNPLKKDGKMPITVPAEVNGETHISTEERVAQLVDECRTALGDGASDYDVALWLHDWLTHNAHYSKGIHYYSEDGVLFRGDGVCDSYCKAYRLLLNAADIECDRIFGTAVSSGVNHAWNRAKLGGEWFQIDVTWDDPSGGVLPVSGLERHLYFGLTDDMMTVDHAYEIPEGFECTSLAQNYFVKTGRAEYWAADVRAAIREIVLTGDATRSFPIPTGNYRDERGRSINLTYIPYGAVLWQLRAWDVQYVDTARGVVEAGFTVEQAHATDVPMVYVDSVASTVDALCLPAALLTLGTEAFAGNASRIIAIPEGATEIPSQAFANCPNLECVLIPATITSIASDAFENSGTPAVTCERGSAAHTYAIEHGWDFTLY